MVPEYSFPLVFPKSGSINIYFYVGQGDDGEISL